MPLAVDSHEFKLSSKAGQARVFFYTNRAWTLTVEPADCSWATVNRTSGNGQEDVEEILFKYELNEDADRKAILHITAGELKDSIVMSQTGIVREWWDGQISVDDLVIKPQY